MASSKKQSKMTPDTTLVFRGFLSLSPKEQHDFITELSNYMGKGQLQKSIVGGEVEKRANQMNLGPLTGMTCKCCGR